MVVRLGKLKHSRQPFKFFNMWGDHPLFLDVVGAVWQEEIFGTPMFQLFSKLKLLKKELKKLNKVHYSNISNRVLDAKFALDEVQSSLQRGVSEELMRNESSLAEEYIRLRRDEESFYRQKSRANWLNLGDQNTRFFFHAVKKFQSKSSIRSVSMEDSSRLKDPDLIKGALGDFY